MEIDKPIIGYVLSPEENKRMERKIDLVITFRAITRFHESITNEYEKVLKPFLDNSNKTEEYIIGNHGN